MQEVSNELHENYRRVVHIASVPQTEGYIVIACVKVLDVSRDHAIFT